MELNIDLGEHPGEPAELYTLAHRVNVACGGHAGDADSMRLACDLAKAAGTTVGAHPSYPDREHFGRVTMSLASEELRASLRAQLRSIQLIADRSGIRLAHVKPHGALYHDANRSDVVAALVVDEACQELGDVTVIGPPDGQLSRACASRALPFLCEGFADRGYAGTALIPRGAPGALIEDPSAAAEQALRLIESAAFQTLCVHSDTPNAVAVARAVRAALDRA